MMRQNVVSSRYGIDTVLAGRYEVRSLLGQGGMAEVYAAQDRVLGRMVAVKLLRESLTEDRQRVIEEFIYGPQGDDPLSPANAQRALQTICARNRQGLFYEFCIAIRHALEAHVKALHRLAQRRRATRRTS